MKIYAYIVLSLMILSFVPQVAAAKPRVKSAVTKNTGSTATGYSKAKLSRSTNSIALTFVNLGSVSKATYTLSYTANGIEQGAMGSVTPSGSSTEARDVYFGTCSHGVCTPHRGIQNAVLTVETRLTSGKTHVKRYRIKI